MSRSATVADVVAHIGEYGELATLVTVGADGVPHVGTVLVDAGDRFLHAGVGSTTRELIRSNPSVSLVWLCDGSDYQLIVDGIAVVADDPGEDGLYPMEVDVRRGILHRLAGRDGPSCRPLGTTTAA